jgi:hypothetical protein
VVELARGVGEVGGDLDGSFLSVQEGGCREQESKRQEGVAADHEQRNPIEVGWDFRY